MAGIQSRGQLDPTGLIRTYRVVTAGEEVPDNTVALYATAAGTARVTTVLGDDVTLAIAAGSFLPIEPHTVTAWSGTAGTLYNCIR